MNMREVAMELTMLICRETSPKTPEEFIQLYKKCYQGILEAEKGELLDP